MIFFLQDFEKKNQRRKPEYNSSNQAKNLVLREKVNKVSSKQLYGINKCNNNALTHN